MKQKAFTLIELLVVVAIIGLLASVVLVSMSGVRAKARDAKRAEEMRKIILAVEIFNTENDRYPNNADDGVPSTGECIGSNAGGVSTFETAISKFMPSVPKDPAQDCTCDSCSDEEFYYSYDPVHPGCSSAAISINRFETQEFLDKYGGRDTSSGGDMNIDTAHYNHCF